MAVAKTTDSNTKTGTVVSVPDRVSEDMLRAVGNSGDAFRDALAIAEGVYGTIEIASEVLGTGFALLENKAELLGKELVFLTWRFNNGDHGMFASAAVITADGGKYIVNDGSSGICHQLNEYTIRTERNGGLVSRRGLRESTYATCVSCGKPRDAMAESCTSVLDNGSKCGNTDTKRGTGNTYYIDLTA